MPKITVTVGPERSDWTVLATEHRTCNLHGGYESRQMKHYHPLNPPWWTNCPACNVNWQAEADMRDAQILGGFTEKQRAAAARLASMNLPPRLSEATVWNWQHGMPAQQRIWEQVRTYCTEFIHVVETGRCMVFYGPPGTGKSHLAVGVLKHIVEKGGTAYYTTVMDMLGRIKATYSKNAVETEQAVVKHLTSVDILAIDEVGRQMDTSYEISQLWRLMDMRYRNQKPMLLVSNLTKDALETFVGDAMWDRLRENGGSCLMFNWGSYRSAKKPSQDKA